jgi:class 3 adenylate cyclase
MDHRQRLDFQIKVLGEEEDGTLRIELVPHPDRYERRTVNGEPCLFDRLEHALIPLRVIIEGLNRHGALPIFAQRPTIADSVAYVESRRAHIRSSLTESTYDDTPAADLASETLNQLVGHELGFAVLSVDVVDSTRLAADLPIDCFRRMIDVALREMSEVVPHFLGHVLKYTGDGLIAYFAEPSYITKNDLAVDCALTIRRLLQALNVEFVATGFPTLQLRMGIDSGEAAVTMIGSARTKRHSDIVGVVVHLATKIQEAAPSGVILLGEATLSSLHTNWRARTKPFRADNSTVLTHDGANYCLYEVN